MERAELTWPFHPNAPILQPIQSGCSSHLDSKRDCSRVGPRVIAAKSRSSSAPIRQALDGWPIKYKLKELTSYSPRGGERTRFVRTTGAVMIGNTDAHRGRGEKKLPPRHGPVDANAINISSFLRNRTESGDYAGSRRLVVLTWPLRCMIGARLGRCQDTRSLA